MYNVFSNKISKQIRIVHPIFLLKMHKSGAQKSRERRKREETAEKGKISLFEMDITSHKSQFAHSSNLENLSVYSESMSVAVAHISNDELNFEDDIREAEKSLATSIISLPFANEDVSDLVDGLDIGMITTLTNETIERYVLNSNLPLPDKFPEDSRNQAFPISIFKYRNHNGEIAERDWLVWSRKKDALFCFPCRLFSKDLEVNSSALSSQEGWPSTVKWRKLCRIPEHKRSNNHKHNYLSWRGYELRLKSSRCIENNLSAQIEAEEAKWYKILDRLIDIILFLGERGLAIRGSTHLIGSPQNGNFLGLIELLSHWDPILEDHVKKVKESQQRNE